MMKQGTSFLKRFIALALALVLLLSNANLGVALQAFAAESATKTAGEIVADNYELTDAEKALLESGYLVGTDVAVDYSKPTDEDNLIAVDTENKTVTAKSENGWVPVTAKIVVGEDVKETVSLTDGKGTYTHAGNAFSVRVEYSLSKDVNGQAEMFAGISGLKAGVTNLKAAYDASDANLGNVVLAIPTLNDLADGMDGGWTTIQFGEAAAAAVKALKEQADENGDKLNLQVMNEAYSTSASKVQYLLVNGVAYQEELNATYNYLKAINDDDLTTNTFVDQYLQGTDTAKAQQWSAFKSILGNLVSALKPLTTADWSAAEKGTALVSDSVNYVNLDGLVAAVDTVTSVEVKNPLLVDTTVVQANLSMYDVTVTVVLNVVEDEVGSNDLVEHDKTASVKLTLAEGANTAEIVAAIEEAGVEADAKAAWGDAYVEGQYVASTNVELPAELLADVDYVITYSPVEYKVTYGYETDAPTTVYYGYQLELPVHENPAQAYDYTVNGEKHGQGEVITIEADTNITRAAGKAYASTDLYTVIANNFGNDVAKAILESGALKDNSVINVRKPDPADAESLLELLDGMLTADSYSAAYENLSWVPYTYGVEGTENKFTGNTAAWDGKEVKVQYILNLTNISVDKVAAVLELVATLKDDAEAQKATLDGFATNRDTMGQLDKTKLGALNGVIDVTDFTPDDGTDTDEANLEMRAYFKGLVSGIIANNLDSDNYLKIYNILGEYNNEGLRYYYENYEAVIAEIESLSGYLSGMLADDDKIAALKIMVTAAGFPEYAEKIADLETKLANVLKSLSEPNSAIDLKSSKLGALVNALTAEGDVVCKDAATPYLVSETLTAMDQSQVMVQVIIDTPKGGATVTTKAMDKRTVLTQEVINELKTKVEAKVAELLGDNAKYYTLTVEGGDLDALVNTELTENVNIRYTYAPTEYTVVIEGEDDQTVTIDDLEINLPKHPEEGWTYEYTVDGVAEITTTTYTFTTEQLDRLFADGSYTITRIAINEAVKKLEKMVDKLNEAVGADDAFVLVSENGVYTGIEGTIAAGDMMNFVMGLTNGGYTYIGLNNEGFLYLNEGNSLELSLQTLINAILHDNGFGSETLIALGNNGKGELVTTNLQLGNSADELAFTALDLTLNLSSVPSQMATVAKGLTTVENYMTFNSQDGVMNVDLDLPEKVYEVYLSALLATGNVDKNDINAIHNEIAFQFLWDYVDLIVNTDATTTTYTNTLAMLGQSYNLTGYEDYYQLVKKALTNDGVVVNPETNGEFDMNVTAKGQKAINALLNLIGMEIAGTDYETYLAMIKEYKDPNADLTAGAVANLLNVATKYEAVILDLNASGYANKFDYTTDLPERVPAIADKAAVMLLGHVDGDLVFDGSTTVLDLNGYTVNGSIVANGTVYIIDSSMDSDECGGITGKISGNVKIIAGNYTRDVSAYLANGYVWNNGPVTNSLYTIQVEKDGDGNITDITFEINSGVISEVDGYIPSVKALAVDIAADLVLNYYTTAALSVDTDTLIAVDVKDVFALLEGSSNSERLENVVNEILSFVYVDTGITNFINNVVDDLLNFANIAEAIENEEAVASYKITTKPWQITVGYVADGDYVTAGVTNNAELAKTYNLNLVFVGDAAKTHLAPLAEELANIVTDETDVTVALTQPTYADKTLSKIGGTVEAVFAADLTSNSNYPTVIGVVLAYGNADKAQAFADAINSNNMDALKAAFDAMTVEEVFTALKKLSRNVDFATMASKVGVTVDTTEAADLEKIYHLVLCGAGKLLEKYDITGYTDKKMGYLYDAETEYYTLTKVNVNRSGDVSDRGYTAEYDATITELTLKVKIFGDNGCNHNYVSVVTAPTCTEQGYTTHTCTICGNSYEDSYVAATGHSAGEAVVENEVAATCTTEGSYDTVVYCSVCGEELSRETTTVPATGHTEGEPVVENEVAATCTTEGSYDTVVYCSDCGEELSRETTTVPATGHSAAEAVVENEVAATCTADGSYDTVIYCSVCGEELSRVTTVVPATGHTEGEPVVENEIAATCSEDGSYELVVYCSVCGEELSRETITVPATGDHVDVECPWHACDICGMICSEHVDTDGDGKCDICGVPMCCVDPDKEHVDENKDHFCDVCGLLISWCRDCDRDHLCDICGETITCCIDFNHNHKCDICLEVLSECVDKNNDHRCDYCCKILGDCADEDKDHYCDICGDKLSDCSDDDRDGKCDWCGAEVEIVKNVIRIGGAERCETARMIADELKEVLGVEKFDAIIYASGNDFADALTGTYLANVENAPVLLYRGAETAKNLEYIQANLSADGVVYILGGPVAVPASVEEELAAAGIKCVRLGGEDRFETNLKILDAAGFNGGETVLVCTGYVYADSLAASATGMPILLVNNGTGELTDAQVAYLEALEAESNFVLVGGEDAISTELANALTSYDADGEVERIGGETRYETSVMLAKKYFPDADKAVLAYGAEFADGLCGGTLGYAIGAPVVLATNEKTAAATAYMEEQRIHSGYVLGGTARLDDASVYTIFRMATSDEITVK